MRTVFVAGLLIGVLAGGLPAWARAEPADLEARLEAALSVPALRGARVAALVVDRRDGRVIYARQPDRPMIPASNLKVLTALAALQAFGPSHRFETHILTDAAPDAEGVVSRLYLRGRGDPALTSEDYWRLAADLRRLGLRRVAGELVLDDSAFDGQRWHPSWGRTSARAYHAPVGALTVNYGAFAVTVEAGVEAGAPVLSRVDPAISFLRLTNRARTGPARARRTLAVDRRAVSEAEEVLVTGVAPAGSDARTLYRSVLDPARYAGAVLRMQLESVGIRVEGPTRVGYAPPDAELLLAFEGHALAEVVRRFLKYSNNSIGEGLVKALGLRANGAPGTWPRGLAALRAELEEAGVPLEGIRVVDGSGLSYENRVTPRALVEALLRADRSFRFGPELLAALPIAASDGTLEERAEGAAGLARAKTGLLTRVTGLSGLAQPAGGRAVTFSVLVNGFRSSAERAMDALDDFMTVLVDADQDRVAVSP
jgi:D-alanyl-D-alanine carboxypeptidase/D-alanyl-D-alanine-endopeptidase (penicillin-binding protein 4)